MDDSKPRNSNIVCVGGYSALRYWSHARAQQDATDPFGTPMQRIHDTAYVSPRFLFTKQPHVPNHMPEGCQKPIEVLVSNCSSRVKNSDATARIFSTPLPSHAFIKIDRQYAMSTPEFAFAQLAARITLVQLIELGYELCGTYVSERYGPVTYRAKPATTVAKLRRLIEAAPRFHGRANAKRALKYIIGGSASPRETQLAMLLSLPYLLGGYGFPQPLLNHRIDLPDSRKTGKRYLVCDQYWPKSKLDLEYDSDEFHAEKHKLADDARRRVALEAIGVKSINVSNDDLASGWAFNELANNLARITGKRITRCDHKTIEQRRQLRLELGLRP